MLGGHQIALLLTEICPDQILQETPVLLLIEVETLSDLVAVVQVELAPVAVQVEEAADYNNKIFNVIKYTS